MKYFKNSEFFCSCGCGLNIKHMDIETLRRLDVLRASLAEPIRLSSSIRCEKYNQLRGGRENSAHLDGLAVDIMVPVPDSGYRFRLIRMTLRCGWWRIGVGDDFVHLDRSTELPQDVMWVY